MMRSSLKAERRISGETVRTILSFAIPVVIFLCAYLAGLHTSFLPSSITMQTKSFDEGIFAGLKSDLADISSLKDSFSVEELLLKHTDPFFILALILPSGLSSSVLLLGYYGRIGLCGLLMYRLIRRQTGLKGYFPLILSVSYALSSPVLFVSSYTVASAMAAFLPVFFHFSAELAKEPSSLKRGISYAISLAVLIFVSGYLSLTCVLPFVLLSGPFLISCLCNGTLKTVKSILLRVVFTAAGLLLASPSIVNSILRLTPAVSSDDLEFSSFRTNIFDMLLSFLGGKAMGTRPFNLPLYFTVFGLIILLLFFFNPKIPLKSRITLLAIIIIYFLSFSWEPLYRISVFFRSCGTDSAHTAASRFILLVMLLIFSCAIALRNIRYIKKRTVLYSAVAVLALSVVSNSSKVLISPSAFSLFFTFGAAIISYLLLTSEKARRDLASLIVVCLGLFLNLTFILPISDHKIEYDGDANLFDKKIEDKKFDYPYEELDFFEKDNDGLLLLRTLPENTDDKIRLVNGIASAAGAEELFVPIFEASSIYEGGTVPMIDNRPMISHGSKVVSYLNVKLADHEVFRDLLIASDHVGRVIVELEYGDVTDTRNYDGPFLSIVDAGDAREFNALFMITDEDLADPDEVYTFFTVNPLSLDLFENLIVKDGVIRMNGSYEEERFILTGRSYDVDTKVYVNGVETDTFELCGKTALRTSAEPELKITFDADPDILIISYAVSFATAVCSIVLLLVSRRSRGGRLENDQTGRPADS